MIMYADMIIKLMMIMMMTMKVKLNSDPHNVAGDYKDDDDEGDDNDITMIELIPMLMIMTKLKSCGG